MKTDLVQYPRKLFKLRLTTEITYEGIDPHDAVEKLFLKNGVQGFLANAFEIECLGEQEPWKPKNET